MRTMQVTSSPMEACIVKGQEQQWGREAGRMVRGAAASMLDGEQDAGSSQRHLQSA